MMMMTTTPTVTSVQSVRFHRRTRLQLLNNSNSDIDIDNDAPPRAMMQAPVSVAESTMASGSKASA